MNPPIVTVVEDSPVDFELIELGLEQSAPEVEIRRFAYGDQALRFLADENEPRPDLVLLDLNLPVMDGFAVLEGLRKGPKPAVPVVVFTSSDRERDRIRAAALGALDYIVKPMDFEAFVDRIVGATRSHLG